MGAAAGENDAADGGSADAAGLAFAAIDAVLNLEKAGFTIGIDVVGNGRAAGADGRLQDRLKSRAEAVKAGAGQAAGHARGTDAGAEEALVGVDVPYSVEKGLVEEGGFDVEPAAVEERSEIVGGDSEGFGAWSGEGCGERKAAEAAGIDEAQLATGGEMKDGVGMRRDGRCGIGNEEAAGHPQVDQELGILVRRKGFAARRRCFGL